MKALVVRKEWLDLYFSGDKTLEIRSANTNIRGKIKLIQAGSGLVVGGCYLVDSFKFFPIFSDASFNQHRVSSDILNRFKYKTPYAWQMERIKKYKRPQKYKHPPGAVVWVNL